MATNEGNVTAQSSLLLDFIENTNLTLPGTEFPLWRYFPSSEDFYNVALCFLGTKKNCFRCGYYKQGHMKKWRLCKRTCQFCDTDGHTGEVSKVISKLVRKQLFTTGKLCGLIYASKSWWAKCAYVLPPPPDVRIRPTKDEEEVLKGYGLIEKDAVFNEKGVPRWTQTAVDMMHRLGGINMGGL